MPYVIDLYDSQILDLQQLSSLHSERFCEPSYVKTSEVGRLLELQTGKRGVTG